MPWVTPATLRGTFLRESLADQIADQDDDVIQKHLDVAQSRIESALFKWHQFSVPLRDEEVPPMLEQLQADLATFGLFKRVAAEIPGSVVDAGQEAADILGLIQAGTLTVLLADEGNMNAKLGMEFAGVRRASDIDTRRPSETIHYGGPVIKRGSPYGRFWPGNWRGRY